MSKKNSHSSLATLDEWLFYLESIHAIEIDMGLARISKVAKRLGIDLSASTVITVAGTNGKGTTCAFLEQSLIDCGYDVAVYSSPHITRFNERLRLNQQLVDDEPLIAAFKEIEAHRQSISLTYYEYTTLAALMICQQQQPDYVLLEVGLGGRLDATNIIDADIAVITSIDLDHQAFLGDTREAIGFEKAGIARANKPLVIGDPQSPQSILDYAQQLGACVYQRGKQFTLSDVDLDKPWDFQCGCYQFNALPVAKIPRDNVASALQVLALLNIPLNQAQVSRWLENCQLEGRLQTLSRQPHIVVDVAHNPHAARYLAKFVAANKQARVLAVCGMLKDKDIEATLAEMYAVVDHWYVGSLSSPRGAQADVLEQILNQQNQLVNSFDNVIDGFKIALKDAHKNDMILVFGSFFTVAEINKNLSLLDI